MPEFSALDEATRRRQHWMGVLAKASADDLARVFAGLTAVPAFEYLRRPEPGSVMVKARTGGTGNAFNLGEMTVTRCSVRLEDGRVGHAYVQGRNEEKAERAAILDALLQAQQGYESLFACTIAPLEAIYEERRKTRARDAARTKVEFFTLVRGETWR